MTDLEEFAGTDPHLLQMHIDDLTRELIRLRGERPEFRVRIGPDGRIPTRSYPGDAGWDLFVSEGCEVAPRSFMDIHTDVFVQPPGNVWGLLVGRSSTIRQRGLLVNTGIIDQGYRGELFAAVWNLTDTTVKVEAGERLVQLILMPLVSATVQLVIADRLDASDRGEKGFGSTGA